MFWPLVLGLWSLIPLYRNIADTKEVEDQRPKTKGRLYPSYLLNNSAAFVPPNPKLFDRAYSTSTCLGSLGM
jgi:hypothetical protein